jgi:hypothetical protein
LASRLDQFPVTPRRAQRSYPWHQWTDGGTWMLVRGEDFDLEIEIFRNKLYAQASRRRLKVRTHKEQAEAAQDGVEKDREVLFVQFYGHTTA